MKSMRDYGWQKLVNWSYKLGLTSIVGLNLAAGVVVIGNEMLQPASAQDGVYLYGEINKTNQLGKGYFIFQQSGQQVVGAMYSPQSEYTCFTGKRSATKIHLQSFGPNVQPGSGQEVLQVALPSLHQLAQVGPADRQVLSACQQDASALLPNRAITLLPRL
jgi:hypothetical protein